MHVKLMLPLDRPYFRNANVFKFPKESSLLSPQLINPHVGISLTQKLQGLYPPGIYQSMICVQVIL